MYCSGVTNLREPKHPIGSVDNALKLLLMFRDHRRIRISEAASALNVVASTAHRLMAMLEHHGLVMQDPESKAYQSGPMLTQIALQVLAQMDIRTVIRPHLERLAERTEESVHFLVLEGTDVLFVDGIESSRTVRTTLRVGMRRPAHCTSGGKALLAQLSDAEVRALYGTKALAACTGSSLRTVAALLRELKNVRQIGYGVSVGESEAEIAAVGTAILGANGQPMGAFSVSMPMTRYDQPALTRVGAMASVTAQEAMADLSQAAKVGLLRG